MSLITTLAVPRAVASFDPATIYDARPDVYGDYFRADLSAVQESSGAFVRWPGLRDTGIVSNPDCCFDLMPWIGTNNVTATGPGGENVVLPSYVSASQGRGGSQSIYIPSPLNTWRTRDGVTVGVLVRSTAGQLMRLQEQDSFAGEMYLKEFADDLGNGRYGIGYFDPGSLQLTLNGPTTPHVGNWNSYVLRRDVSGQFDGNITVFDSGNLSSPAGTTTQSDDTSVTLNRWWTTGSATGTEIAGFFRIHEALSDAECLAMLQWLMAGAA